MVTSFSLAASPYIVQSSFLSVLGTVGSNDCVRNTRGSYDLFLASEVINTTSDNQSKTFVLFTVLKYLKLFYKWLVKIALLGRRGRETDYPSGM